jgi:hypothetical protein
MPVRLTLTNNPRAAKDGPALSSTRTLRPTSVAASAEAPSAMRGGGGRQGRVAGPTRAVFSKRTTCNGGLRVAEEKKKPPGSVREVSLTGAYRAAVRHRILARQLVDPR